MGRRQIRALSGHPTSPPRSRVAGQVGRFGVVGLATYFVDVALYNFLTFGIGPLSGPLESQPLAAKTVAVASAATLTWLFNRIWAFRNGRSRVIHHEIALFALVNVGGLLLTLGCLAFSRYILGLHSQAADNVSANVIGFLLATAFRFWGYRHLVFRAT